MRILKMALLIALLLALAAPALAELAAIDHYVIKADVRAYMTDEDIQLYKRRSTRCLRAKRRFASAMITMRTCACWAR